MYGKFNVQENYITGNNTKKLLLICIIINTVIISPILITEYKYKLGIIIS
jgi:hypothetical protein